MGLSWGHVLIIILVVLLLFGAEKLPELGRSLGKAMAEFKKGFKEGGEEGSAPTKKGRGAAKKKKK
jgi:TatA/E family protein of Tat protein translocase